MITEARKAANRRWDAAHMETLGGVKVRRELADRFRAVTAANGDTVAGVFRAAMLEYLEAHGQPWEPAKGRPEDQPPEE